MFRIECFCDDKKLAEVHVALVGLIVGNVVATPVVNVVKTPKGVKAKGNGRLVDIVMDYIKENKIKEFGPSDIKPFVKSLGRAKSSYSNVIRDAMKAGWLRRVRHGPGKFSYVVTAKA